MANFNLTDATNLFKIKYGKLSDNTYNSANVLLGRVKKDFTFTGRQLFVPVPQSFAGGVGSGSLPASNVANYEDAIILAKKVYATTEIDREAIKASMNDEGAFVRGTKEVVKKAVESYMRNMSRILFNDGTGSLAAGDASTTVTGLGTSGSPYIVVLASDTKDANIEEKDFVNYDAETTNLEVVAYVPSSKTISLVGTSVGLAALTGVGPVLASVFLHMQGSKDNDPEGLKGVLDATSGSKYSVPIARRWQAQQKAAGGAGLTTDLMNEVMLDVQQASGKVPNMIITSFTQYRKLLNLLEDQKQYVIEPRSQDLKGKVAFKGIEYMSAAGAIGVFPERFCEDDRMYFLNDNWITIHHRPDFGWFEDDGTVFLRKSDDDAYNARYGGYLQVYVVPSFHGVLTGLAT
ncbi:phage major capsid protein [Candidatus Woesearchaeota archaeon]|nr:phage major capsid protein [Candidatus Woesearchaeota archaeon]